MKVVVIGASTNTARYSYLAVISLLENGHEVYPLGKKKGEINGIKIINEKPVLKDIHTITLYVNPTIQNEYIDYIVNTIKPVRVIFNPGTENPGIYEYLTNNGIEVVEACTLVMLSTNQF
ncbi:MAG: CoA-binding protein [Marinilabiliales bacterium]